MRDIRKRQNIPPKQMLDVLVKPHPEDVGPMLEAAHIVRKLGRVDQLSIDANAHRPANSASVVVGTVQVFVLDCIDDAKEGERLGQEIAEVDGLIAGKQKKLDNANFVGRAPAEVVQRERDRLAELQARRERITATLETIKG